ncbi:phenolic glucoside malonyltransferase 1-like [Rutidosis leptorrhynchoides]|uniref:phenolic glucoside malonyltransferase 1-like n=1 Tax=Rutidosis leptorrhynchoides TaxID=125765 RepID=UPI003A98EDFE
METTIPSLKSSLSLTLRYFYPFVSSLIVPPAPQKPYFLFDEGNSVPFTVVQFSGHFNDVIRDRAKVQVTLFPNQGICIGVGFDHVVADGKSFLDFIKSWAVVCRSKGVTRIDKFLMPSFNSDSTEDPFELESKQLQKWQDHYSRDKGHVLE